VRPSPCGATTECQRGYRLRHTKSGDETHPSHTLASMPVSPSPPREIAITECRCLNTAAVSLAKGRAGTSEKGRSLTRRARAPTRGWPCCRSTRPTRTTPPRTDRPRAVVVDPHLPLRTERQKDCFVRGSAKNALIRLCYLDGKMMRPFSPTGASNTLGMRLARCSDPNNGDPAPKSPTQQSRRGRPRE